MNSPTTTNRRTLYLAACATIAVLVVAGLTQITRAQKETPPREKRPISLDASKVRAKPPTWSVDVLDAFFPDARKMLVGERPDFNKDKVLATGKANNTLSPATADATSRPDASTKSSWSKLITAETLETEVKRTAASVATNVTTPGPFKATGFKTCRRDFSLLAALFAVTADYDGQARWQDVAPGLREEFARAGRNAKVGTDATYNEATSRKRDLDELIRGSRPEMPAADKTPKWSEVADRPPLMQRLNIAQQERLTKWVANEREFTAHRDDIRHEAQIVATLGHIIGRESFENWDDNEYAIFARELRDSATDLSKAAEQKDYDLGRKALDRASKACANCHDGYRG